MKMLRPSLFAALVLGSAPAAAQWRYPVDAIVEADPTGLNTPEAWVPCKVLEHGPGPGSYKTACALPWARTGPMTSEGYTPERRIRAASAAALRSPTAAGVPAAAFRIGQTVLASPAGIEAGWTRCVVRERMAGVAGARDAYKVDCVNAYLDHYGRKVQAVSEVWAKANWMKADQPGFHPEWQLATARGQDAAHRARAAQTAAVLATSTPRPAAPRARGGGGSPRTGNYECWANGSARMNMNFRVTGPGSYRNDSGAGRFGVGPGGRLTLTGPMLESMPDGFVAVYHEPGGRPTVSFRSPRGAEAAFCELPG